MATDLPGAGDRELVRACREGSEAAWEALVRKYRRLVYSMPHRSGLRQEDASEVFQAVFLALFRNLEALRQEDNLLPWLVTTARRESWKLARAASARSRDVEPTDDVLEPVEDAGAEAGALEQMQRQVAVRSALDRLDERCRRLLEILFYNDPPRPYAEISAEMGMPVPSIGPTRIRCLEKLRKRLEKDSFFT